jgi:hypothetical protein
MEVAYDEADSYRKYRGRCKEMSEAAIAADPTLTLVRGHYFCPIWRSDEPHWWCVQPDGAIVDPTREQFPSRGHGIYTPFDGVIPCSECGKEMTEDEADVDGNYAFCSHLCHGRFVGVF